MAAPDCRIKFLNFKVKTGKIDFLFVSQITKQMSKLKSTCQIEFKDVFGVLSQAQNTRDLSRAVSHKACQGVGLQFQTHHL